MRNETVVTATDSPLIRTSVRFFLATRPVIAKKDRPRRGTLRLGPTQGAVVALAAAPPQRLADPRADGRFVLRERLPQEVARAGLEGADDVAVLLRMTAHDEDRQAMLVVRVALRETLTQDLEERLPGLDARPDRVLVDLDLEIEEDVAEAAALLDEREGFFWVETCTKSCPSEVRSSLISSAISGSSSTSSATCRPLIATTPARILLQA